MKKAPLRTKSPKPYKPLYLAVVIYLATAWFWLFTVKVPDITPSKGAGYALVLTSFLILVSLSSSIFFVAIRYLEKQYRQHDKLSAWFLVKLVVIWATIEWLVSLIAALIWLGQDGSTDTVLPFGSLTPLAIYSPLRFLTRLVGFHGFSAIMLLMVCVIIFPKLRRWAAPVVGMVIGGALLVWLPYRTPTGPSLSATVLSGQITSMHDLPGTDTQTRLVVYPEYGLSMTSDMLKHLPGDSKERFYVGSDRRMEPGTVAQNVLIFGSTKTGVTQRRPKSRLIPGGEYLPYTSTAGLRLFSQQDAINQFRYTEAIERGPHDGSPLIIDEDIKLGSAVCASIISTNDYREFTNNGATVLTNSASLGLFNSPIFTKQHEGLARFMATANARPFLQSSYGNNAFALDHNGRMLQKTGPISSADVVVQANTKKTPYSLVGEWVVYVGLSWALYALLRKFQRIF